MNTVHDHRLDPSAVSADELRRMSLLMEEGGPTSLVGPTGDQVALPAAMTELLAFVLETMEHQQAVVLMPEDQVLTTNQAAAIVGVSRPYLIRLLDEGKLPCHRTGTHRRIRLADLRAYQAQRDLARHRTLDALTVALDAAGVYDRE